MNISCLVVEVTLEEAVLLPALDPDPVLAAVAPVALHGAVVGLRSLDPLAALGRGQVAAQEVGALQEPRGHDDKPCRFISFLTKHGHGLQSQALFVYKEM